MNTFLWYLPRSSERKVPIGIVEAVGGRIPVLVDSGFRRGSDIVKALALGATAVCIGRPYLWGLGAFGQPGVERGAQGLVQVHKSGTP